MSLVNRLAGIGHPEEVVKLSISAFWAMLYEMAQGKKTKADIVSYFNLDAGETDELQWVIDRYNAQSTATAKAKFVELMLVIFMLAESHVPGYTTNADIVARINAI